ncbi:hypothetical protein WMY93_023928 [Mugilogobius chulae]|uniref:Alpha-carbonic anhydrase domain-containing protein n=1 Tax=Mugilogobius chulae TaxID=88201 RepID=A0AAW0NA18_9GOBI
MVNSVIRPLVSQLQRQLVRAAKSHRSTSVRRCNLTACSSKFVLSQTHPMWQEPLAIPGGDRQSPIDIAVRKSVFDSKLKPLVTNYDPKTCQQIWNNGYSFLVEYDDTTDKSTLKGGPLQDNFRLCQFHFHWGECNSWGLSTLWTEDCSQQSVVEFTKFDPACLLPSNIDDYWTYHGSLTTPPLTESVTWIVMKQHIEVSHDQLAVFRSLLFTSAEEEVQKSMVNNFRETQPLRGRTVRSSFTPFLKDSTLDEVKEHSH